MLYKTFIKHCQYMTIIFCSQYYEYVVITTTICYTRPMSLQLFEELGLSPNEARIYDALLTYGGSGVSTIALRSGVHRSNSYDTLNRLIEKGLVYEVFGQRETIYEPVDPEKFLEFLDEKKTILEEELPTLLDKFQKKKSTERAYVYKGIQGVKNYLRDALNIGEDIYSFAAKGAWFDPRMKSFLDWFLKEAKKKNMNYHHIFDHEVREKLPIVPETVGMPYRFLPKNFSTNSTIDIFEDRIVTFTGLSLAKLDDNVTIFVVASPRLAESYRTWWKYIWNTLPKEKIRRKSKR